MFSYSLRYLAIQQGDVVALSEIMPEGPTVRVSFQHLVPVQKGERLLAVSDNGLLALRARRHTVVVKDVQGRSVVRKTIWEEPYCEVSACFVPWPVNHLSPYCRAERIGEEYMIYGSGSIYSAPEEAVFHKVECYREHYVVDIRKQEKKEVPTTATHATYSSNWGIIVAFSGDIVWLPWDTANIGVSLFRLPHPIRRIVARGNLLAVLCPIGAVYVANLENRSLFPVAQRVIDIGWQGDTLVLLHAGNPMMLSVIPKEKMAHDAPCAI